MTLRYIALTLAIGCLYSCSSAKKAQSTTDDTYYSDGSQDSGSGYVANDGSDDRVQPASTADNYNQYAYSGDDYAPFSTFADPYWAGGLYGFAPYGMGGFYGGMFSPYMSYSMYGPGFGFYHSFGYNYYGYPVYPPYYGGFYNPYYPGFGYYYSHPMVASVGGGGYSSLFTGGTNRVNTLAYNNRHYNNVTTTVAPQGVAHPTLGTISGRTSTSIANNKVTTNGFTTYRPRTTVGNGQPASRTFVRQGNTRTNQQPVQQRTFQQRTFQQQTYRPAPSSGGFNRGGGGGFGGGGRVGGGGFGRH